MLESRSRVGALTLSLLRAVGPAGPGVSNSAPIVPGYAPARNVSGCYGQPAGQLATEGSSADSRDGSVDRAVLASGAVEVLDAVSRLLVTSDADDTVATVTQLYRGS